MDLRKVRIVPRLTDYAIEIVYKKEVKVVENLNANYKLGIDTGMKNIITIADNIGNDPSVIKGGIHLSINQFFNN